ncbi:C58 family peptidase [Aliamphritea ceti]|uniref:C58 family peptidase n=1 Tax=Aliamphritea ceti TaxID=1524258 RepID=UPI0021C3DEA4|nr:C58 family peptidase [Aliamphritea ceti]
MPNIMSQWAVHYHGRSIQEFDQSNYIARFKPELRAGCCMTLCCCWILSKGNVSTFKQFINSKIGENQVKGFQGLAMAASGPASALGGYYTGYIKEIWRIFSIRDDNVQKTGVSRNSGVVREFVMQGKGFYQLHFQSSTTSSGHAIAFLNTGDSIQLFDPNYGLIIFEGKQRGGNFDHMLGALLKTFYPDLDGQWDCVRGQFP